MITPYFFLEQTDEHVVLNIKAPFIKAQEVEYHVEGPEFYFYSSPYYLRLCFNQSFVEDGQVKITYDTKQVVFHLPKAQPGEFFTGLDLLSTLLYTPTPPPAPTSLIEELDTPQDASSLGTTSKVNEFEEMKVDTSSEVRLPASPPIQEGSVPPVLGNKYGFNNQYSGFFARYPADLLQEIMENPEPETLQQEDIRARKGSLEQVLFDEAYYL